MGPVDEKAVPSRKLRVKFLTKKPVIVPCSNSERGDKQVKSSFIDDWRSDTGVYNKHGSGVGVEHVIGVSQLSTTNCLEKSLSNDDEMARPSGVENSKSIRGTKRRPEQVLECSEGKRLKMDRSAAFLCGKVLEQLMKHRFAVSFLKPVDPVFWGINDYFDLIKNPMDLGTVKKKLQQNGYSGAEEFEADVRLTFDNAMLYNPANNWVHQHAKELGKIFDSHWKPVKVKLNKNQQATKQRSSQNGVCKIAYDVKGKCVESVSSEAHTLSGKIILHKENVTDELKRVSNEGQCCELIGVKDEKVKASKPSRPNPDLSGPASHLDKEILCLAQPKPAPVNKFSHKEFNVDVKNMSTLSMGISDQDSDGAASCVDEEHACASFPATAGSLSASSTSLQTAVDIELSPSMALRALKMKTRFADTIRKAQNKTLLQPGGKHDALTSQQEKEKQDRKLREEEAMLQAQVRAAESAARLKTEREIKKQRQQAREAARAALEKMERSIDLDDNFHTLRDLEDLAGSSYFVVCHGGTRRAWDQFESSKLRSPLERLGLYIKAEYMAGDDDDDDDEDELSVHEGDLEEGELVL